MFRKISYGRDDRIDLSRGEGTVTTTVSAGVGMGMGIGIETGMGEKVNGEESGRTGDGKGNTSIGAVSTNLTRPRIAITVERNCVREVRDIVGVSGG